MITVIAVTNGSYNVLGTKDGMFIIQGNLNLAELMELRDECNDRIEEVIKEEGQ